MLYLLDRTQVAAEDTDRFLEAFETVFLPPARARGMKLVACWHTPDSLGEDVVVTCVWEMRDWAHWDELRRGLVLDPALPEWLRCLAALRRSGTREFVTGASFSPLR